MSSKSKRTLTKVLHRKNIAWETLAEQFKCQVGVKKREVKQIKKCWENIQSRAKKFIAKEKREAKPTGGCTASTESDEGAAAVVSIIPDQIKASWPWVGISL